MSSSNAGETTFDRYAACYDSALSKGISASGESKDFFARGRVEWLKHRLDDMGWGPETVLDFGCGTGSATPHILQALEPRALVGVDISIDSLAVARLEHTDKRLSFLHATEHAPDAKMDLAFSNGVFHHIPVNERAVAVDYVYRSLRPGGLFALWENNAWNPATLYVMSRCPFDDDAVPVSLREARRLLRAGGFEVLRTDFIFIFPRALRRLRGLEPLVSRLPLGTQYQVLCRKPAGPKH